MWYLIINLSSEYFTKCSKYSSKEVNNWLATNWMKEFSLPSFRKKIRWHETAVVHSSFSLQCLKVQVNLYQKHFFLENMGRTCCVQKLFWMSETISVHNMFSPGSEIGIFTYWTYNSMNNIVILWLSWCKNKSFW